MMTFFHQQTVTIRRTRRFIAAFSTGLVLGGLSLSACQGSQGGQNGQDGAAARSTANEPAVVVTLGDDLKFTPAKITVKAGQAVQWKNASVLVHTVTDVPDLAARKADYALPKGAKPFNSGNLAPDATFEHAFATPGHYKYFCIPHEAAGMVAEIEVVR